MNDLRAQLTTSLGTAFKLERELGGGGMSRVFVAHETALDRSVVVKVLLPELLHGVSVERFKREIAVAARLQHPHIVPLLSAGETDGLPYYCMPLIEGESLRSLLARTGELPISDAVRLLRDVASALAYAHGKGVVHRDIKPENILLTAHHAVVTDFGVAKALSAATEGGVESDGLTSVGIALGTPAYMAPEQAAGEPSVDHRADIYAWGIVAYEVLTGQPPFAGRSSIAQMAAHFNESPEPVGNRRSAISAALAALVMRCLEKHPADRPQRTEEVLRALDSVAIVSGETVLAAPKRSSVAVLPMVNTSGNPENEHFSDGLTDELIGALGKVASLTVTGRTSSFALKGKGLDVRAIAEKLRVTTVLEGSVRRAGNRLKVSVQLVNADGSVLWSDVYDRQLEDVFAVQEEIAQAVVRALEVRLAPAQGPLVRPPTADVTAYDLYLKGKFYRRRVTPNDLQRAIQYFEQAIARDPAYALAYAWLGHSHMLLVVFGSRPAREEVPRVLAYTAKALELDAALADAHWTRAEVLMNSRDWLGGEQEFRRALALDPGNVDALHMYGVFLVGLRREGEAATVLMRALAADPLLSEVSVTLGRMYMSLRQPDRALPYLQEAVELAPFSVYAHTQLGRALLQTGKCDDAIAAMEHAAASGDPSSKAYLAYALAVSDRRAEAEAVLAPLISPAENDSALWSIVALVYVALGDPESAFQCLERAYASDETWVPVVLNTFPELDPLRGDLRFTQLLQQLGLAPAAGYEA
ncbi:MAG: protein kinase [Gemmatimonadaceae bacterium]